MSSRGRDAAAFAARSGLILDDWQLWLLDMMLSEDADVRWAAMVVVLILPRQNGKNAVLEAFELYMFYVICIPMILHTAHLGKTAAGHMRRMVTLVNRNPELKACTQVYNSNGKEALVRYEDGVEAGRLEFVTRSKETSRGGSPGLIVFDEALFLNDVQMQAILPALSAQTMNDDPPMIVYTSSAPLPESVVLHRVRDAGISGEDDEMFFAEWSVPADDYADLLKAIELRDLAALGEAVLLTNPGAGIRISERYVLTKELYQLSPTAFLIERLGYVPPSDAVSSVLRGWAFCLDSEWTERTPVRVSLSVSPGGVSACFAIAGTRSDGTHVEVTEHRDGTSWIVDEALRATKVLGKLVVDPLSPTVGVLQDLRDARVPLQEVTSRQYIDWCAGLQVAVQDRKVHHIGQAVLDAAVSGAEIRSVRDGGWVWSRKASTVDICPLEAATLAWGANRARKPRARYIDLNAVLAAAEAKELENA